MPDRMHGSRHDTPLPLNTARLKLRLHRSADRARLHQIYSRPEVARFLLDEPWTAEDAERDVTERLTKTGLDSEAAAIALVIEHDGALIGDVLLWLTDTEGRAHRVTAQMDARNGASATLATAVGMTQEAHLRQDWWSKGEWTDTLIFARLATDR